MKKLMRLRNLAIIIAIILPNVLQSVPSSESAEEGRPYTPDFSDVSEDDQYATAVFVLQNLNIIGGYPDGTFKPEGKLNRAEFLKILIESEGIDTSDPSEPCFPDIDISQWYAKYVCYAKIQGWVEGYPDGSFRPANGINKVEALKMLAEVRGWDYVSKEKVEGKSYSDVDLTQWYGPYLAYAMEKNLIDDTEDAFGPGSEITRGQLSEYVYRDIVVTGLSVDKFERMLVDRLDEIVEVQPVSDVAVADSDSKQGNLVRAKVIDEVIEGHPLEDQLVAFMLDRPFKKGSTIGINDISSSTFQKDVQTLDSDTWLVFVDLAPSSMWGHETLFVFVNDKTLELEVKEADSFPMIDGVGIFRSQEMREITDLWVWPEDKDTKRLSMPSTDQEGATLVAQFKPEPGNNVTDKEQKDFESSCPKPYCFGKDEKKLALVIEGFPKKDGFQGSALTIYQGLRSKGYDVKYISAAVGSKKEHIPKGEEKNADDFEYLTIDTVKNAFKELAAKVSGCCDDVVIYMSGHGHPKGMIDFNMWQPHYSVYWNRDTKKFEYVREGGFIGDKKGGAMTTKDLKGLLDSIKVCKTSVMIFSCYSGSHIKNGINKEVDDTGCLCRTVFTSSTALRATFGSDWSNKVGTGLAVKDQSLAKTMFDAHEHVKGTEGARNMPQVDSTDPALCEDPDKDQLCTGFEKGLGTDPTKVDTDGDTLSDFEEYTSGKSDPLKKDTDDDKLDDAFELNVFMTDAKNADTDEDGLNDQQEQFYDTDPNDKDTDDDGCFDGREALIDFTDPHNPESHAEDCAEEGISTSLIIFEGQKKTLAGYEVWLRNVWEDNTILINVAGGVYEGEAGMTIQVATGIVTILVVDYPNKKVEVRFQ